MTIKSVLILDDDQEMLDALAGLCQPLLSARIIGTRYPTKAIQLANEMYFDIILIDVNIPYNGSQFGGLDVYKILCGRYGSSSILAYSQYINDELLQRYGLAFNFMEKDTNLAIWISRLVKEMRALREKQTCFVAMPFGNAFHDLYNVIKLSIQAAGYKSIRIDERAFTRSIVDKIFEEIRNAKLVIFVASGRNPNVYYEVGYSVALQKEVLTITESFSDLPFDIRDRNALSYGTDPTALANILQSRIAALTDADI
jgi:CheY-like chemotaxis protein